MIQDTGEIEPLDAPVVPFVEEVDTKSIRVPVAKPPLPDPVPVASVLDDEHTRYFHKRPNIFLRLWRWLQ